MRTKQTPIIQQTDHSKLYNNRPLYGYMQSHCWLTCTAICQSPNRLSNSVLLYTYVEVYQNANRPATHCKIININFLICEFTLTA